VLLILDGHFSHIPLQVLEEARVMNIDIFTLPSHTTHFLQPLDVVNFQVFKRQYEKALHAFPLNNNGRLPTKNDIVALTVDPWQKAFTVENIRSGFRKTGIFPLSIEVMVAGVVGDGAANTSASTIPILMEEAFTLTDRQKRFLSLRGVSQDRARVCTIGLMAMVHSKEEKQTKERTFVDGGVLMTSEEMISLVRQKQEGTATKELVKLEKQRAKEELKLMREEDKKGSKRKIRRNINQIAPKRAKQNVATGVDEVMDAIV
jgi:F0F1-type ATP synthase epsilon subunit